MTLFCYRVIIDTRDSAVIKADWIPISNGSESSALLICATNGGAIALGWDLRNPLPVLYPGPYEAMQTPQASLGLSVLLQLLL